MSRSRGPWVQTPWALLMTVDSCVRGQIIVIVKPVAGYFNY
jgi:hypothetical protein